MYELSMIITIFKFLIFLYVSGDYYIIFLLSTYFKLKTSTKLYDVPYLWLIFNTYLNYASLTVGKIFLVLGIPIYFLYLIINYYLYVASLTNSKILVQSLNCF